MQDQIRNAIREALKARRNADEAIDTRAREQWLRVAETCDAYIRACEQLEAERDAKLSAIIPARSPAYRLQ